MGKKICENCEQIIGNLEESFYHNNQRVCKTCKAILQEELKTVSSDLTVTEEKTSIITGKSDNNVDETSDGFLDGRMNRARYFLYMFVVGLIAVVMISLAPEAYIVVNVFAKIAVACPIVRRLHDMDKSGALYFLTWIPLVSLVIGLMLLFCKGTEGPNKYGEDPLAKVYDIPNNTYNRFGNDPLGSDNDDELYSDNTNNTVDAQASSTQNSLGKVIIVIAIVLTIIMGIIILRIAG